MGGSTRSNDGSSKWTNGHCDSVGTLTSSSGITNLDNNLRIGVGDSSNDGLDWALFMIVAGNGAGDFAGSSTYAFGSEGKANTGYAGEVSIIGIPSREVELFVAQGTSATYANDWSGWYSAGNTAVHPNDGKRTAYDSLALSSVRFSDDSGQFAEYTLSSAYAGQTLLQIVVNCMGGSTRSNDGSSTWTNGHCDSVGILTSSSGISNLDNNLRIGVGDASNDGLDWALFMVVSGNGAGDFAGSSTYAYGSEGKFNTGFSGQLKIIGIPNMEVPLFSATGSDPTFANVWSGWLNAGSSVTSGDGKTAAYDTAVLSGITFSDASGAYAKYVLSNAYAGQSLLQIVQSCMDGSTRSNDGSSTWTAGHCTSVGDLDSSSGISNLSPNLRIGVGDASNDGLDWALFMVVTGNGAGDFVGSSAYAFGSEGQTNTGYTGQVSITGIMQ